jgi:two-component system, NarL family, nitrate/nitrite response regulator NarL
VRVLIVDGHQLFAEALRFALQGEGMEVRILATSGEETLQEVAEHQPQLVLVDLCLPGMSGIELGRTIVKNYPGTFVVAVTGLEDFDDVRAALRAGFHGYFTKNLPLEKFVSAIQSVTSGQVVIPRNSAPRVAGARTEEERHANLLISKLTLREKEVLALISHGANSRDIAMRLNVSSNTVRSHVQNILTKLQVHSRLEAAAFAVRHGVVDIREVAKVG